MEITSTTQIQPINNQIKDQVKKEDLAVYTESLKKNEELPMSNEEIMTKFAKAPVVLLTEDTQAALNDYNKQNNIQKSNDAYSQSLVGA